jgi:hypothetical protein
MGKLLHKLSLAAAVAALSLCASQASANTVFYSFATESTFDNEFTGFFSANVDPVDFLFASDYPGAPYTAVTLQAGDWLTCGGSYDNTTATCDKVVLSKNVAVMPGMFFDIVDLYTLEAPSGSYSFYFQPGAFTSTGASMAFPIGGPLGPNGELPPSGATLNAVVPEPATWAMMIMGFGAIGATLRNRRRHLAAA